MRPDMHKVVIERPRWNPGPAKLRRQANLDPDLLPRGEGMRRPYRHRKSFTDLLGPLRRWLRAQVGRPWNDVYSEACAVIKPDSVVRAHIKTHLLQFVHRDTFLRDGEIWCYTASSFFAPGIEKPVADAATRWSPFYVHPRTGRLCESPLTTRARRDCWRRLRESFGPEQRWLGDTHALLRLNGLWFDCVMAAFPAYFNRGDEPVRQDVALKRPLNRRQAHDRYGRYVFCVAKHQLNTRELRRHGLANVVADWTDSESAPPAVRPDGFLPRSYRAARSEFGSGEGNHFNAPANKAQTPSARSTPRDCASPAANGAFAQRADEMLQFLLCGHSGRKCLADFRPHQFPEATAQPMDGNLHRTFIQPQPGRRFPLRTRLGIKRKPCLEHGELIAGAGTAGLLFQLRERTLDDSQRPFVVEERFELPSGRGHGNFESGLRAANQGDMLDFAAPLHPRRLPLAVGDKVLQCAQQVGTELPATAIRAGDAVAGQQGGEELVGHILGLLGAGPRVPEKR